MRFLPMERRLRIMERAGNGWLAGGIITMLLRGAIGGMTVMLGRGGIILWFWLKGGGRDIMGPVIVTLGGAKTPPQLKGLGRGGSCLDEHELGLKGTGTEVGLKGPGGGNKLVLNGPGIEIDLKGPGLGGATGLLPNGIGGLGTKPLLSAEMGTFDG